MNIEEKILVLILEDFTRRLFMEGIPRIKICLHKLSLDQIWYKHNENVNSVGNLILHLCGNVRQYILTGIDGQEDIRQRSLEFSDHTKLAVDQLVEKLDDLEKDVLKVLSRIKATDLIEERKVQGFDENITSILIHVAEHFSYHVGQITFYTKWVTNEDTGYYAGLDLDVTG